MEKNTGGSENTEKSEKSEKPEKSDKSEKSETSQNTQNTKKAQNTPEPPKKAKTQIRHLSNTVNGFDYSFSWMQGRRPTMEDEHIIEHLEIDSEEPSSLFAVLDGHGGSTAATLVKLILPQIIKETLITEPLPDEEIPVEWFHNVFQKTDAKVKEKLPESELRCGSTCAMVLIKNGHCYFAHIGDSRLVAIDRRGELIYETHDHKVRTESEMKRIQCSVMGQWIKVENKRLVNYLSGNSLSVARAFGDFHFKPNEYGAPNPVSVRPVVRRFPLNSVFGVILVCDGVTEAVKSLEVVKIAAKEFLKVDDVMDSRGLAIRAYKQGSGDNISVGFIRMGK